MLAVYWEDWLSRHRAVLKTAPGEHEWRFATEVLTKVRGLDPAHVYPQHPFTDGDGGRRRMDFAVLPLRGVQVALEIDGWDKTGERHGMSRSAFEDFVFRATELSSQGWLVLRFTNQRFIADPIGCAKTIELALRREVAKVTGADGLDPVDQQHLDHLLDLMAGDADRPSGKSDEAVLAGFASTDVQSRGGGRAWKWWVASLVFAGLTASVVVLAALRSHGHPTPGKQPISRYACPDDAPIKGNISQKGDKIYHLPTGMFYERTTPERCFANESQARAAGYRPSSQ